MSILYENIRGLCEEYGVSIREMCLATGISSGNITDLKMGRKKNIIAANIGKIADYFNVSTDRVLYGTDKDEDPEKVSARNSMLEELRDRKEMKMLFKAAKDATPEQIEAVVKLLETMKKG